MYSIEQFLNHTKKVPLLPAPTPLHRMSHFGDFPNIEFYIKRDDMTGVGPGGNKIRSLEFLLGEAKHLGCTKIMTAGPQQSNLCTLTASACAKTGFDCELVFNCDEPTEKTGNILLNSLLEIPMHFIGHCSGPERNERTKAMAEAYTKSGIPTYVIDNGASTGRGALGYVAAALEIKQQCQQQGIENMTIFVPAGHGGVATGFIYGNELIGHPFSIVVISIEDNKKELIKAIRKIVTELEEITQLPLDRDMTEAADIIDDYRGTGWGANTKESSQMIYDFAKHEGIFIENVYNSKVLVGMKDWALKGKLHGPVCFLHTGGFGSLFSQYQ